MRLDIYRRLAEISDPNEVEKVREELIDRFGEPPLSVELLLQVAILRARARTLGVKEVIANGKNLKISPIKLPESKVLRMHRLYPGSIYKGGTNVAFIALPAEKWSPLGESNKLRDNSIISWATSVLSELLGG